jgi:putative nucleotidyltransferase with HDIG domain
MKLPVDVFIRLGGAGKFVLLVKAGDLLHIDRASGYEQKKVEELYVRKEDYSRYLKQNLTIAGIVITRDEMSSRKKVEVLGTTMNRVFDSLEVSGLDVPTLEQTRNLLLATIELVESKKILSDLLAALAGMSDELIAHSMAVAVVSAGMGCALGWTQPTTLEKLSLGGLFHDIGMRQLPPELLSKPFALMDFEEVQTYESHVARGQQILQSLGFIPQDVVSIVYEHHENQAGQGYPRRLKSYRIHPLAKFVSLADAFCDMILKSANNPNPKGAVEAAAHINQHMAPLFAKEALRALDQFLFPMPKPKAA